jgi:hypothetical protein
MRCLANETTGIHNFVTGRLLVTDSVSQGVYMHSVSKELIPDKEAYRDFYMRKFGWIYEENSSVLNGNRP